VAGEFDLQSDGGDGGDSGTARLVLLGIVAVGLVVGVVGIVPRFRHLVLDKVRPELDSARENLRTLSRTPGKFVLLFSANTGTQLLFATTLSLSLHAYGESESIPTLLVINIGASLIGGLAPIPGGMGVVEAGLIAGLTAVGVPEGPAMAATFTHRACTTYLPPIWGWPTLAWLRRHDYL
jgi:uncharacterized protein (TIRG00374 family)